MPRIDRLEIVLLGTLQWHRSCSSCIPQSFELEQGRYINDLARPILKSVAEVTVEGVGCRVEWGTVGWSWRPQTPLSLGIVMRPHCSWLDLCIRFRDSSSLVANLRPSTRFRDRLNRRHLSFEKLHDEMFHNILQGIKYFWSFFEDNYNHKSTTVRRLEVRVGVG